MMNPDNGNTAFFGVNCQMKDMAAMEKLFHLRGNIFSLSIAICNSPAFRTHLIDCIQQKHSGVHIVTLGEQDWNIYQKVQHSLSDAKQNVIFVFGFEKIIKGLDGDSAGIEVIKNLNVSREAWKNFNCPIVFWMPEYIATLISVHARDLYSWISHRFEFVSEIAHIQPDTKDVHPENISSILNLTLDEKHFRIAELLQRLEEVGKTPSNELINHILLWFDELGTIYASMGELDKAEEMYNKALDIDQRLGKQEGMAKDYCNLGNIYQTRGELNRAVETHNKALDISQQLGRQEGMANQYGNLGNVYRIRGELDKAVDMYNKVLDIEKKLGRQDSMANAYGNLGIVYKTRGELDKAVDMYNKVLDIEKKLGRQDSMANAYGNLGIVYQTRGELDKAVEMYNKSLEIDQRLGLQEGMASDYANLGTVYLTRGDKTKAREYYLKSIELYRKIGAPHMVEKVEGWLKKLDEK